MDVLITGGSGFIGTALSRALKEKGYGVHIVDMRAPSVPGVQFTQCDLLADDITPELFAKKDAVVHLAGKNLFVRWNEKVKKAIYDTRVRTTQRMIAAMAQCSRPPKAFISASAVGYYGNGGEQELFESSPPGDDFLSRVCRDWEKAADQAQALDMRVVKVRTAPVLGDRGFLDVVLPFYKLGLGGPVGSGKQWFPWIHLGDIVGIYVRALENDTMQGAYNACAPQQLRFKAFSQKLAAALHRPHFMRIPVWGVRLLYDGMADVVENSARVVPKRLTEEGYAFRFLKLTAALEDIVR